MIKIIPILNFFLVSFVIYLKIIYVKLHWISAKLLGLTEITDNKLRTGILKIVPIVDQISLIIIMLAAISLAMGFICFKKRIPNLGIGLIIFLASIFCFLVSLIIV